MSSLREELEGARNARNTAKRKLQLWKKELIAMNRSDIVEKWLQTNLEIYEEYKNYPYMVELKDQKYVKTVNRYSKFLEITDTGLKI